MQSLDLRGRLRARGLTLSAELEARLDWGRADAFFRFLTDYAERGGFFSRADQNPERILERHVYECLVFVEVTLSRYYVVSGSFVSRETKLLDAGTGPGLPGYLFACLDDAPRVFLLDSSRRRLALLEEWHSNLARRPAAPGGGPDFLYARAEEHRGWYDLITARAFVPFPPVVELLARLQTEGGVLALFGTDFPDRPDVREQLRRSGYVSRETVQPDRLAFLGLRTINLLRKELAPQKGYPRNWKRIKDSIAFWKDKLESGGSPPHGKNHRSRESEGRGRKDHDRR